MVFANTETLYALDSDWNVASAWTHPLMGGIHDILAESDGVWVTCTAADLLVKFGWSGEVVRSWAWRDVPELKRELGLPGLGPVARDVDYRDPVAAQLAKGNSVHLNGLTVVDEGLLVSFGRVLAPGRVGARRRKAWMYRWLPFLRPLGRLLRRRTREHRGLAGTSLAGSSSAVVQVNEEGTPRVVHRSLDTRVPNHNVMRVDGLLVFNDTNAGCLRAIDDNGKAVRSVAVPGDPSFARGLEHVDGLRFLVGSQHPLATYLIDLDAQRLENRFLLDGPPEEAVHGIARLPTGFSPAPKGEVLSLRLRQATVQVHSASGE